MKRQKWVSRGTAALMLWVPLRCASPLWAQAGTRLGLQTLGRGYWHVFAAYAIVWILILGWVISIVRRLRRVEERLSAE
jgi:CcmD family protein